MGALTLQQPAVWSGMVLPAGSHVVRDAPPPWLVTSHALPEELPDGSPDLRYLSAVRFPQAQQVGAMWLHALSVYPPMLELARAYPAGGPHCQAGAMALFEAKDAATMPAIFDSEVPPPLDWTQWQGPNCFLGEPIRLRYWSDGALVWAPTDVSVPGANP